MNRRINKNHCGYGNLPAKAPLANPYVPYQSNRPQLYDPRKGFARGTMFTGLDLPFKGMVNNTMKQSTPVLDLQTLAFVIQELALYLDTHKDDQESIELYKSYQEMYQKTYEAYSKNNRQLSHLVEAKGNYNWLNTPWPWEYCANKEG